MHIVFCSDRNYLPWCVVPAVTAIEQSADCVPISIHLILSEDCKRDSRLGEYVEKLRSPGVAAFTYFVDDYQYSDLPVGGHGSTACYYRLLIPELLPAEINKVIYLDCDLLVLESLADLWNTDLAGIPMAAVSDMSLLEDEAIRLGLPYMGGTFNSGVLVMNLSLIRQEQLHLECMKLAVEMGGRILYWDQDVLNILLQGRWLKLDNCWNVQHRYAMNPFVSEKYFVGQPKIVHFTGHGSKPWQSNDLPYSEDYMLEFDKAGLFNADLKASEQPVFEVKSAVKSVLMKMLKKSLVLSVLNPLLVHRLSRVYGAVARQINEILSDDVQEEPFPAERSAEQDIIDRYFSSLIVQSGPFRGMKYPSAQSVGSALLPKLVGS